MVLENANGKHLFMKNPSLLKKTGCAVRRSPNAGTPVNKKSPELLQGFVVRRSRSGVMNSCPPAGGYECDALTNNIPNKFSSLCRF